MAPPSNNCIGKKIKCQPWLFHLLNPPTSSWSSSSIDAPCYFSFFFFLLFHSLFFVSVIVILPCPGHHCFSTGLLQLLSVWFLCLQCYSPEMYSLCCSQSDLPKIPIQSVLLSFLNRMYVCIYVTYIYIYMCVCVCVCVSLSLSLSLSIYIYIYIAWFSREQN